MKSRIVSLMDVCRPKQWPTISGDDLTDSGYSVYGANGKIGFYSEYNHEEPTLLITCRGATCGTMNICEPKSYVTGNAMALDDLKTDAVDKMYLYYYLRFRGFKDVISGSAQPQITRQGLEKVTVPLVSLNEQKSIATKLTDVEQLQSKRKQTLVYLDSYLHALFIEMFGDPVINPMGWPKKRFKDVAEIKTGNTPSRANAKYYGNKVEWIKSDNLNTPFHYATRATEFLSDEGEKIGRMAPSNSILVTCIAGSKECIGNSALVDRAVAFNQQINSITCGSELVPEFVYCLTLVGKRLIQAASTNSMKGMVSKGKFEEIEIYMPPVNAQKAFANEFKKINQLLLTLRSSETEMGHLFQSLLNESFGEVH